jgi:hypothetical protein
MSERETVVELPWAADCCPCVRSCEPCYHSLLVCGGGGGGVGSASEADGSAGGVAAVAGHRVVHVVTTRRGAVPSARARRPPRRRNRTCSAAPEKPLLIAPSLSTSRPSFRDTEMMRPWSPWWLSWVGCAVRRRSHGRGVATQLPSPQKPRQSRGNSR